MRPLCDSTGTLAEATAAGCSRRTIQRRRAAQKKAAAGAALELAVAPALPGMSSIFLEPPAPARAEMEECAARAAALESLLYKRALAATAAGDPVNSRLWTETWARSQLVLRHTEDQILEIREHKSQMGEFLRKTDQVLDQLRWNQRPERLAAGV
jgi:hypothetical protein